MAATPKPKKLLKSASAKKELYQRSPNSPVNAMDGKIGQKFVRDNESAKKKYKSLLGSHTKVFSKSKPKKGVKKGK